MALLLESEYLGAIFAFRVVVRCVQNANNPVLLVGSISCKLVPKFFTTRRLGFRKQIRQGLSQLGCDANKSVNVDRLATSFNICD